MSEETGAIKGSCLSCVAGLKPDFQSNRSITVYGEAGTGIHGKLSSIILIFLSLGPNKHSQDIVSIHQMLTELKLWQTTVPKKHHWTNVESLL